MTEKKINQNEDKGSNPYLPMMKQTIIQVLSKLHRYTKEREERIVKKYSEYMNKIDFSKKQSVDSQELVNNLFGITPQEHIQLLSMLRMEAGLTCMLNMNYEFNWVKHNYDDLSYNIAFCIALLSLEPK